MGNSNTKEVCMEALKPLAESFKRTGDLSAVDEFFDAFDVNCSWYYMKNAFKAGASLNGDLNMESLIEALKKKMKRKSSTHIRNRLREEFIEFLFLYDEILQKNPRISVIVLIRLFREEIMQQDKTC